MRVYIAAAVRAGEQPQQSSLVAAARASGAAMACVIASTSAREITQPEQCNASIEYTLPHSLEKLRLTSRSGAPCEK